MSSNISAGRLLIALIKKDIRVYSRNMIYLFLMVLGLAFFVAIYWLVPDQVEEDITFAITPPLATLISEGKETLLEHGVPEYMLEEIEEVEAAFKEEEGFLLVEVENEDILKKVIGRELDVYKTDQDQIIIHDPGGDKEIPAGASKIVPDIGMSFPSSFLSDTVLGHEKPTVTVFADAAVPEEIRGAMEALIREMAYQLAGKDLPVEMPDEETIILGQDRIGDQISMRAKMRPLIAFFILMMETFSLASLISNEVLQRTVTALLVTPVRTWHFLMAKTLFGTALAMGQAVIVLILVGAFSATNWLLLLVIVLLGSLLFTAVAMLVGASGKDFIGQLMYSMLFLIPLMIPSFAVLFPGTVATWVNLLPTYPIVRLLHDVTIYGIHWLDSINLMIYAALWTLAIYGAGLFVLKRKVAAL